jgi:hypothetical protein
MFLDPYQPGPRENPDEGTYAFPGDLLSRYPGSVVQIDGSVIRAPASLDALSGASVRRFATAIDGGIWTAQRAVRVVGIQISEEDHGGGRFARARSWKAVSEVYYHP